MNNIAVYLKGTTDFFSQGLGILSDVISSELTSKATATGNSTSELIVEYPISGYLHDKLVEGNIIRVAIAKDSSKYGIFQITDTLKSDAGVLTVYAKPYSNRILRMTFDNGGKFGTYSNVQVALNDAKSKISEFPSDFILTSAVNKSIDLSADTYEDFGTFLEALNKAISGNIYYGLNTIQLYSALGKDRTDIILRDDRNTSSVKVKTDFSSIINKVVPVLPVLDKNGNHTQDTKLGTIVKSAYGKQFIDFWAGKVIAFDTQDLANSYFNRTNSDRPIQTVDVDPIELDEDFSTIELFDRIQLYSTILGYKDTLRVSERVFDTLTGETIKFSLGSSSANVFNSIQENTKAIFDQVKAITSIVISANGKNQTYISNVQPTTANEGDMWIQEDGDYRAFWIWKDGEWVKLVDSDTQKDIADGVTNAINKAKADAASLIETNNSLIRNEMLAVSIQQANNEIDKRNFESVAKSYANNALNDANANALVIAQQTLDNANTNLDKAKADLTTRINKESKDRDNAVIALDTTAKSYATTAKNEAIAAANTADGKINKKIDDTASSITSTISQNKIDADGKITVAQTKATQALTGLSTKVSLTEYNAKTGKLQADLITTSQTATQAKQDIVSIKQTNTSQDSRMNQIVADADGTKQTISNIKTTQGVQSGNITTLQSRADGFEGQFRSFQTALNDMNQVNQLTNTEFNPDLIGWDLNITNGSKLPYRGYVDSGMGATTVGFDTRDAPDQSYTRFIQVVNVASFVASSVISLSWQTRTTYLAFYNSLWITFLDSSGTAISNINRNWSEMRSDGSSVAKAWERQKWENIPVPLDTRSIRVSFEAREGTKCWLVRPMLVFDKSIGSYSPGQYNNNDFVATVAASAKEISANLVQYKTEANGKISKAEASIIANAKAITVKVDQSDYNAKTGILQNKVAAAQLTADNATLTIGNYKQSNDGRITTAETRIKANSDAIALTATKQDLNNATGSLTTAIGLVNVKADSVTQSVSSLTNQVNLLGQVNLLHNTEFNPDMSSWGNIRKSLDNQEIDKNIWASLVYKDSRSIGFDTTNLPQSSWAIIGQIIPIRNNTTISLSYYSITWRNDNYANLHYILYDGNYNKISDISPSWASPIGAGWQLHKIEGINTGDLAKYIAIRFEAREGYQGNFTKPMLIYGNEVGPYTPGTYNNNDKIALQQITIDGITQTVSSQGNNINSVTQRIQTAEGTLSTATNNISGLTTKQTQMAGQINQEVTDRKNGDSNTLTSAANYTSSQISSYDIGLQTQLTQTSSAFLATVSASNLVLDSSLTDSSFSNSIVNWIPSGSLNWYYSPGVSNQGVQSMGYSQTSDSGTYSFVDSQTWSNNSFSGSTLNVSVDVKANAMGGTSTDYLIVMLMEQDSSGKQTQRTDITGTLNVANNNWVNYRKKITVNSASKKFFIRYQMRGNGNVYVTRPYVGVQELIAGGYTAGTNNNNQTILSLFKDNWSIGILDNVSGIVNGIVGDQNSISVINKNITLDATNTVVTGDFWAKAGSFIKLSASNITAGVINASDVRIINLDASSISSGTLNVGIQLNASAINTGTLNSRLLYGDTGHLNTVDTGNIINKYDYHLQISSYGMYNSSNNMGQLNFHSTKGSGGDWDSTYSGSLTYHVETSSNGQNIGLRFWKNHIMSMNKDQNTALYLNPYAGTQVRVTSRTDDNLYYAINASAFNVASDRKFKTDIHDYTDSALDIIKSLRIRKYIKSGKQEIGIIADEADDELILKDKKGDFLSLYDYISIAVKAIQEQSEIIESLIKN